MSELPLTLLIVPGVGVLVWLLHGILGIRRRDRGQRHRLMVWKLRLRQHGADHRRRQSLHDLAYAESSLRLGVSQLGALTRIVLRERRLTRRTQRIAGTSLTSVLLFLGTLPNLT